MGTESTRKPWMPPLWLLLRIHPILRGRWSRNTIQTGKASVGYRPPHRPNLWNSVYRHLRHRGHKNTQSCFLDRLDPVVWLRKVGVLIKHQSKVPNSYVERDHKKQRKIDCEVAPSIHNVLYWEDLQCDLSIHTKHIRLLRRQYHLVQDQQWIKHSNAQDGEAYRMNEWMKDAILHVLSVINMCTTTVLLVEGIHRHSTSSDTGGSPQSLKTKHFPSCPWLHVTIVSLNFKTVPHPIETILQYVKGKW